ncbi:MAG: hypothetical protein QXX55_00550 [Candidatus Pacearchaeota archaeon]
MIIKTEPLSMAEALDYLDDEKDNQMEFKKFIKKFIKISPKDAKEIRKKLESLGSLKMKPEDIVKIVDIMPEDSESLNKIFNDLELDENETKRILEIIKEYK